MTDDISLLANLITGNTFFNILGFQQFRKSIISEQRWKTTEKDRYINYPAGDGLFPFNFCMLPQIASHALPSRVSILQNISSNIFALNNFP